VVVVALPPSLPFMGSSLFPVSSTPVIRFLLPDALVAMHVPFATTLLSDHLTAAAAVSVMTIPQATAGCAAQALPFVTPALPPAHELVSAHQSGAIPWQRLSWVPAASLPATASPGYATSLSGDVVALKVWPGLRVIVQGPVTWPLAASLMADTSPGHMTCSPGSVVALEVRTGLWGIAQGPLMGTQQWPSRAFCGFVTTTGVTSLMPTLPMSFALSPRAERAGARSCRPWCCHSG
jgi:hypothetical protein